MPTERRRQRGPCRRRGRVDDGAAALGELRQHDAAEHLGVVQHQRAGQGDRRRAAGHRHAEDRVRAPGARRLDDHLARVARQLERADRADAEADERAAAELVLTAGDHRGHLDQLAAVVGARRLGADRLTGVVDGRFPLVGG